MKQTLIVHSWLVPIKEWIIRHGLLRTVDSRVTVNCLCYFPLTELSQSFESRGWKDNVVFDLMSWNMFCRWILFTVFFYLFAYPPTPFSSIGCQVHDLYILSSLLNMKSMLSDGNCQMGLENPIPDERLQYIVWALHEKFCWNRKPISLAFSIFICSH